MSQPNSHTSGKLTPNKYHPLAPTKTQVLTWLHTILPHLDKSSTIQSLGTGTTYCKIINHYVPHSILPSRLIPNPANQYEYCLNLKQLQLALAKLRINLPFDINKVSKKRFIENWNLIILLYRYLEGGDFRKPTEEKLAVTPKRSHPQLPVTEKKQVLEESRSKVKENFNPNLDLFQKGGLLFMVDRTKEILISNSHDTYKIQLISHLFGVNEEVKLEENEENNPKRTPKCQKTSTI